MMILDMISQSSISVVEMLIVVVGLMTVIVGMLGLEIYLQLSRMKQKHTEPIAEAPLRKTTWLDLFRRKGVKMDKFVEGHEYDGIREYDNSPPAWFNWLFYVSVFCAFSYMMYYHVLKIGDLQTAEYENQVKAAAPLIAKAQEKAVVLADLPRYTDEQNLMAGKIIFTTNCAICHGEKGQGNIGPNLTDEYWLHGGQYAQVFKTIFNGVPEKGMLSWKKTLKPEDIRKTASYVYSLRGTNPPGPKAPQGIKDPDVTASKDVKTGNNPL
jgi:cytochrome c oxidase cbb3-type subunit 3